MELDADVYGATWADDYDTLTPIPQEQTDAAVHRLVTLAGTGPVLEVAAGTGRLSLAMAEHGLQVTATDVSEPMLAKLRQKDPAGRVVTRVEPMQTISGTEHYSLIICAYNSIVCLQSQDDQLELFLSAAAHLDTGGKFVVESTLLDPRTFKEARPLVMTDQSLMARFGTYDVYTQTLEQYYLIAKPGQGASFRPDTGRLVTPAELDLMARVAGMRLIERYSAWQGTPVTGAGNVISIFERT